MLELIMHLSTERRSGIDQLDKKNIAGGGSYLNTCLPQELNRTIASFNFLLKMLADLFRNSLIQEAYTTNIIKIVFLPVTTFICYIIRSSKIAALKVYS